MRVDAHRTSQRPFFDDVGIVAAAIAFLATVVVVVVVGGGGGGGGGSSSGRIFSYDGRVVRRIVAAKMVIQAFLTVAKVTMYERKE